MRETQVRGRQTVWTEGQKDANGMHSKRAILRRRKIRSNRKRSQFNRIHLINLIRAGKHECCLNDYRRSRVISDTNEIITSISSSHPDGDDLR